MTTNSCPKSTFPSQLSDASKKSHNQIHFLNIPNWYQFQKKFQIIQIKKKKKPEGPKGYILSSSQLIAK